MDRTTPALAARCNSDAMPTKAGTAELVALATAWIDSAVALDTRRRSPWRVATIRPA
jgi:hypothetical protein